MNPNKNLKEPKPYMNTTKNLIEPKPYMNPTKNLIETKLHEPGSIRFLVVFM
jgi:hypothetical protein